MSATLTDTFAPTRVDCERRDDGSLVLRCHEALEPSSPSLVHAFREGSRAHPDRVLAGERVGDGWRTLSWGQARRDADGVAQALLDRGLGPDRPLMILSGNSIEHLMMLLGAYTAGVPVMPISTAYSLQSADHRRLKAVAGRCPAGMVFADDGDRFAAALAAVSDDPATRVCGASSLAQTVPGAAVERAVEALGPDTVAKVLFTSGSTGVPRGVVNTHRMLCSNQQALSQVWPFLREEPPVLVDWLPWSHTFGGNHNLNQVLCFGGSLYIDAGKPVGPLFGPTEQALREIAPTTYYNVPAGWALLAPLLERDAQLAGTFFSRLRFMFNAAAALPEALWQRLRAIADAVADHPVALTASWGATETAPAATSASFAGARCGWIGIPLPGVTLKLVPDGDRYEARVSGPNVTPGYVGDDAATATAFDDEGFYRTGDAVRLVQADEPELGLRFDGRLAEDFKLMTGTWVNVGPLRTALLSAAPGLRDVVITGHDREFVAAMAWPQADAAATADPAELAGVLAAFNAGMGSAARIERLMLLEEPPSMDAGEITDKGYINQRAVLERRADAVEHLYGDPAPPEVVTPLTGSA